MIRNRRFRVSVDERGKITSGRKTEKGYPQAVDYFNIDDFPELKSIYGEKPNELLVLFPSDEIESFFDDRYVIYGQKSDGDFVLKRVCDGEECIHRIKEDVAGTVFEAGEISECICDQLGEDDKARCRYVCHLKAFVCNPQTHLPENPLCYLFQTGSENSGSHLYSELKKIHNFVGHLFRIPFRISVDFVQSKIDIKKRFPIWKLVPLLSIPQMQSKTLIATESKVLEAGNVETADPALLTTDPVKGAPLFEVLSSELDEAIRTQEKQRIEAWLSSNAAKMLKLTEEERRILIEKQKKHLEEALPF